jgi:CRP-like cAMP-binding protein
VGEDLFSTLPPIERHVVSRALACCPCVHLPAGEASPADPFPGAVLLMVEAGTVAVVSDPGRQRRMVVAVARAGGVLAAPSGDQQVISLEDASVRAVTDVAWRGLLERPAASALIVDALLDALRERELNLAQFASVAHVERVRGKLLQLSRAHGRRVEGGVLVELPLTHALLAEMVGSARETVTGAVRALEAEGFLVREDGRYRLAIAPGSLDPLTPEPV